MNWGNMDEQDEREPRETLLFKKGRTSDQYSDSSAKSKDHTASVRSVRFQLLHEEDERRKQEQIAVQALQDLLSGKVNLGGSRISNHEP